MKTIKKIVYHYFVGVLFSASIVMLVVFFDYFLNGYFAYPELSNFISVCFISGLGFGLTHFASFEYIVNNKKNK
jgi:hypothetical protein